MTKRKKDRDETPESAGMPAVAGSGNAPQGKPFWLQPRFLWNAALFCVMVLLLTQNFMYNLFQVGQETKFEKFEPEGNRYILYTAQKLATDGLFSSCGLICDPVNNSIYWSHCGLQGFTDAVLLKISGMSLEAFARMAHFTVSMLLAIGLALFAFFLRREFGWITFGVFLLGCLCSDWMVFVARNLWYLFHLHLWPFFLSWLLFARVLDGKMRPAWFFGLIALTVYVKAATGYEYITNVILGATVPVVYYWIVRGLPFMRAARYIAGLTAIGIAAFALAFVVNSLQVACYYKSLEKGFQAVFQKAAARTYGPESTFRVDRGNDAAPPGVSILRIIQSNYLPQPAASIPFRGTQPWDYRLYLTNYAFFSGSLLIVLFAFLDGSAFPVIKRNRRKLVGLAVATVWSLACTLTWAFMAKGHMWHHPHIDCMSFYVTYMLMFYAAAGFCLSVAIRQALAFRRGGIPAMSPVE